MVHTESCRRALLLLCLLTITATMTVAPAAAAPSFELVEYLGEPWLQERVSFPVTLPAGLDPAALAVREAGGQVLPAQFSPEAPGSRQGTVYFILDLPPYARQQWTLVQGQPNTQTDLFLHTQGEVLEMGTSRIAIRCPFAPVEAAEGVNAAQIGPPILGVRQTDGSWTARGEIGTQALVTAFRAEILDQGPVFNRVRFSYSFVDGGQYTSTIETLAGQEVVLIRDESEVFDGPRFLEGIRPADAPQGNYTMHAYGPRLFQEGNWWTLSLPGDVHGKPVADPGPVLTLNPTHGEWWRNVSWWGPVYPQQGPNYLAVLALNAGLWRSPHDNVPVLEAQAAGQSRLVLPINRGARSWGLYCGHQDVDAVPLPEEKSGVEEAQETPGIHHPRPAHLASIKYGLLPLDMVKDWVLDPPDPPGVKYPRIYADADRLEQIRQSIQETPVLREHAERLKRTWDGYRAQNDPNYPFYKWMVIYDRGLDNIYLATGDESYAQDLAQTLIRRLRYYMHQTKAGVGISGYRWSHGYGMFHLTTGPLPMSARQADIALGSPSVTPEQKQEIKVLLAFFGELFGSRDYGALGVGYNYGNTDMVVAYRYVQGLIASVLSGHPRAMEWAEACARGADNALTRKFHRPGPDQDEHYALFTMSMITSAAIAMRRAGLMDLFDDPRMREGLEFFGRITVPPDPRHEGGYVVPFGNGQAQWDRAVICAEVASALVEDDPEFASQMMWYWQRSGMAGSGRSDFGWDMMGRVDTSIPAQNPGLVSEVIPDWGVVFRSGCGTEQETFLALQIAKPGGLYNYNAEGGFQLHAQGMPLSLLFGIRSWDQNQHSGYANATMQRWLANRPSFAYAEDKDHGAGTGKLAEWATGSGADLATGQWTIRRLEEYYALQPQGEPHGLVLSKPRPYNPELKPGFTREKIVEPITWRRHVMFVKDTDPAGPNYFVFRDWAETSVPWDWSIWCLASEQELAGSGARFTGKFGVNLDIAPLTPAPEIVTGAYGPTQSFAGDWRQLLYQVQMPAQPGEFAAVLYPRAADQPAPQITPWAGGAGGQLTLPGEVHYLVLTDAPTEVRADGQVILGRAAVIRLKPNATVLTLLSGTQVGSGEFVLTSADAQGEPVEGSVSATLVVADGVIVGESEGAARQITLELPAGVQPRTLTVDGRTTALNTENGRVEFTLPAGAHRFLLQ